MAPATVEVVLGRRKPAGASPGLTLFEAYEDAKARYVFGNGRKALFFGHTNNMAVRRRLFGRYGLFVERDRGSDTIFVRTVSETAAPGAVGYDRNVVVHHAEVRTLLDAYRKVHVYGKSWYRYTGVIPSAQLSHCERMYLFRQVASGNGLSIGEAVRLSFC